MTHSVLQAITGYHRDRRWVKLRAGGDIGLKNMDLASILLLTTYLGSQLNRSEKLYARHLSCFQRFAARRHQ
jgi:hypothetical protein